MGPELENNFSREVSHCGMYNPQFSAQEIFSEDFVFFFFFFFFWNTSQINLAISQSWAFLLALKLCPAVQPRSTEKGFVL